MKTEIAGFCKEYDFALSPLVNDLKSASDCIERESRAEALRGTLAGLQDVGMRLKSLADKIEGQQAYLLIFGPLKSGKSTLMNAISGTYVSEVTSLPAYPCLVYVRHGEKAFTVTSYDGKEKSYPDNPSLQEAIAAGHASLAERILEKEHQGAGFDPGVDFPEAIRRIDIRLPISGLVESSTVMVDTPGLYSRMKFGYDLMTREFRDSAACAVFVVKTDNLYLEQVFAEFKDLLELFSRIFLVVNIDSGKRDLRPDGTLQPSLESQHPGKIIEAFETLAMNAQLKDALDDGRLRIYPIDLLNSAADHLRRTSRGKNEAAEEAETAGEDGSESRDVTFETFRQDLTEFLNSNEYFLGFMRDSLRQGATLCGETRKHCGPESLAGFAGSREALEEKAASAEAKRQAVLDFRNFDNKIFFRNVRQECETKAWAMAQGLNGEIAQNVEAVVTSWSESDDSLRELLQGYCSPILREFAAKVDAETIGQVRALADTPASGAEFPRDALTAIDTLGISLPEIGKNVVHKIEEAPHLDEIRIDLDVESVPVRKSFLDWILFRNQESIRRRLLGAAGDLSQPIPRDAKLKRLGQEGLQAIRDICVGWLNKNVSRIPTASSERAMGQYSTGFLQELNRRVDETMKAIEEELGELRARSHSDEIIAQSLENLQQRAERIERRIAELTEIHLSAAQEVEIEDAQPSAPVEEIESIEGLEDIEDIEDIEEEDPDALEKKISLNATSLFGGLVP